MDNKWVPRVAIMLMGAFLGTAGAVPTYSPATDPAGNLIGLSTQSGRIAYDFIDMWFNQNKPAEAFEKYVAREGFMEHAVYGATKDKTTTFDEERAGAVQIMKMIGSTKFDIKQVVAQGELVFMHIAVSKGTSQPVAATPAATPAAAPVNDGIRGDHAGPREMIEILRVHKGKIYDHWDLHVATNSNSVVFEGLDRKL